MTHKQISPSLTFSRGIRDGLPIALGYLSVSFGFGVAVVNKGLPALYALLLSLFNETSAGQMAGLAIIAEGGPLIEMILVQLVINLRYALMGLSLTQCIDKSFTLPRRMLLSFCITDEIFAVASTSSQKTGRPVNAKYFSGLSLLPYIGWGLGTLLGALLGSWLPTMVSASLNIMLYGMFLAIILPPARAHRGVLVAVLVAVALSCILSFVPFMTSGFSVILCALSAAALAAWLFPVKDEGTPAPSAETP